MSRPERSSESGTRSDRFPGPNPGWTSAEDGDFYQHVLTVVDEASTPITVSTLAERLDDTDDDSGYGDVHEALYRDCLQTLDAEGALVFDMDVGLVYDANAGVDGASDGSPA